MALNFSMNAGEPIQFSKEKQNDSSREEAGRFNGISSKLFRAYRPGDAVSGGDPLVSKSPLPFPAAPNPPVSNKRNDDLLDKQKNWIFVSPKDDKKADTNPFGTEESSLEEKKGVVGKFLEKPSLDRKSAGQVSESTRHSDELLGAFRPYGLGNRDENAENKDDSRAPVGSLQPQVLERSLANREGSEKSRLSEFWRDQFGPDANKLRAEKQSQLRQFENLFAPPNSSVVTSGTFGSVSEQNNFGIQSVRPLEGVGSRFNPNLPSAYSDSLRGTPNRILGSSTLPTPDINSRVFGASPLPRTSLEPVRSVSQPAVLPVPKRHF
ncbi:MAG: hypothetical protein ABI042_06795 [Verrucomicrobiota bacterium]